MTTLKDIFLNLTIVLFWLITTLLIGVYTDFSLLVFLPLVIAIALKIYLRRSKKISEFVKEDFKKMGFELIEERPLKSKEFFSFSNMNLKPTIFINDIPIEHLKYKTKFRRIFKVKSQDKKYFELDTFVGEKWNKKIDIEILKQNVY